MYNNITIINELDRAFMIDSMRGVDRVMIINDLLELRETLFHLSAFQENKMIKLFRNSHTVYGNDVITVPNVTVEIIPDIVRFNSTTEIRNHLTSK